MIRVQPTDEPPTFDEKCQVHEDKIPQEPPELLANVRFTVEKLGLKEDWATRLRSEWYQLYQANELTWEALNRFAPMVARAAKARET